MGHKGWIQVGNKSLYFGLRPQQNYSLALEHWDLVHIYAIVLLFPFGLFFFGVCSSLIRVGVGGGKGASKAPSNTIHEGLHWYDVYWRKFGSIYQVFPPANVGDTRDTGLIPGSGRSPSVGNGNPLQYFCLENSMDRGAWRATVHGVTKSQIQLRVWAHSTSSIYMNIPFSVSNFISKNFLLLLLFFFCHTAKHVRS